MENKHNGLTQRGSENFRRNRKKTLIQKVGVHEWQDEQQTCLASFVLPKLSPFFFKCFISVFVSDGELGKPKKPPYFFVTNVTNRGGGGPETHLSQKK